MIDELGGLKTYGRDGLAAVDHEVQYDLLELNGISANRLGFGRPERKAQANALAEHVATEQTGHVLDDRIDVGRLDVLLVEHRWQSVDDFGRPRHPW
jgi:hypothetical protein